MKRPPNSRFLAICSYVEIWLICNGTGMWPIPFTRVQKQSHFQTNNNCINSQVGQKVKTQPLPFERSHKKWLYLFNQECSLLQTVTVYTSHFFEKWLFTPVMRIEKLTIWNGHFFEKWPLRSTIFFDKWLFGLVNFFIQWPFGPVNFFESDRWYCHRSAYGSLFKNMTHFWKK